MIRSAGALALEPLMKIYLIALATGILVGVIYASLHVRSPAPPVIALIGLLGILIGEQIVPTVKRLVAGEPITAAWFTAECIPKITGTPIKGAAASPAQAETRLDTPAAAPAVHTTQSPTAADTDAACDPSASGGLGKRDS